jgi:hypothetical protein
MVGAMMHDERVTDYVHGVALAHAYNGDAKRLMRDGAAATGRHETAEYKLYWSTYTLTTVILMNEAASKMVLGGEAAAPLAQVGPRCPRHNADHIPLGRACTEWRG